MKKKSKGSIIRDYYHWYKKVTIITKTWLYIKFLFMPVGPEDKVCVWFRIGEKAKDKKIFFLQKAAERKLYYRFNCVLSTESQVGDGLQIPHPLNVVIGKGTLMGENCTIYQDVTIGQSRNKYPAIGNNVIVYAGAKIIGNVMIGNNVIIGANTVVTKDIPDNCVVVGNPGKIIKKISEEELKEYH